MKSIGARLTVTQAVSALLFLVVAIVGIGSAQSSRVAVARQELQLRELTSLEEIADLLAENRIAEAYLIFDNSPLNRELLENRNQQLNEELASLRALGAKEEIAAGIDRLASTWREYLVHQKKMVSLAERGQPQEATKSFSGPLQLRFKRVDATADSLIAQIRAENNRTASTALWIANSASLIVFIVTSIGVLIGLAILFFVRRRVVGPLASITTSLTKLAAGDLEVVVSGGERRDEIGAMVQSLEVFRVHASRLAQAHRATQDAQAMAESLARHDALTGLPNRRMFVEALTQATKEAAPCAVLLLDLDRFKPINDVHGHEAGDAVLCELAARFAMHRDELGTVARLGGDEFAILMRISSGADQAIRAAQLASKIVSNPIQLRDCCVEVGATIGIAIFPDDGADPAALLRAADLAMYQAKAAAPPKYRFFEPSMHAHVQERAALDADLRRAITANEIRPYYQPLVSIDGGDLVGFEILSRWHHPTRGLVMPDLFIPAADERGLLTELTYQVLREACVDAQGWPKHLKLSLNLAPGQLLDPLLAPRILSILSQNGIAPGRVEIEVTENALISDLEATKAVLSSLQNLGMTIALDDFGTGYSSLYHLCDLKFDKIKIDKSFVRKVEVGGESEKIVCAMIGLGKSLGLTTTAEGIEDVEQWSRLSKWGCDYGQGYLFGKAMSADDARELVNKPLVSGRQILVQKGSGAWLSRLTAKA